MKTNLKKILLCSVTGALLAASPFALKASPSERGGGVIGEITYIDENGKPVTVSGPLGMIREIGVTRFYPDKEPMAKALKERLQKISEKLPLFEKDLRKALSEKVWKLDPKPINQSCEEGLQTLVNEFGKLEVVACQNRLEIRVSKTWYARKTTPTEHQVAVVLHEMIMNMNLKRQEKRITYDEITSLDSTIYSMGDLSEEEFAKQVNLTLNMGLNERYVTGTEITAATAEAKEWFEKTKENLCRPAKVIQDSVVFKSSPEGQAEAARLQELRAQRDEVDRIYTQLERKKNKKKIAENRAQREQLDQQIAAIENPRIANVTKAENDVRNTYDQIYKVMAYRDLEGSKLDFYLNESLKEILAQQVRLLHKAVEDLRFYKAGLDWNSSTTANIAALCKWDQRK